MKKLLLVVLLAALTLGSDSPKEYDDKTEAAGIEGEWRWVGRQKIVMTFHHGTWTIDTGDGEQWWGSYRIDTSCKPSHLDMSYANGPFVGRTIKNIYQIDGDRLRVADCSGNYHLRPRGFNDEAATMYIYKRAK